jgi:hypothetical protein
VRSKGVCAREKGRRRFVQRAERDSREQRKRAESLMRFGKWFTEKFSVNRFPQFTKRFSGQITNLFH